MVSCIIPAIKEPYLDKTVSDVRNKARGDIEVIVIEDRPMRTAINEGVARATGKYIMKLDAHCMLDEGFDEKLVAEHQPNWVQVPRRKRFDPKKWELTDLDSPDVDYMFIQDLRGYKDNAKNRDPELKKVLIDDTEVFQGSCYFMERDYFLKLGLLDDVNFGKMGCEAIEVALKVRHNGGRVVVNKKTWYAHAHLGRHYAGSTQEREKSREYLGILMKQYV
jgi:glycosyltransferase involved in cell wall biosynthesis